MLARVKWKSRRRLKWKPLLDSEYFNDVTFLIFEFLRLFRKVF